MSIFLSEENGVLSQDCGAKTETEINETEIKIDRATKIKRFLLKTKILPILTVILGAVFLFLTAPKLVQADGAATTAIDSLPAPSILLPAGDKITTAKPVVSGITKNETIVAVYVDDEKIGIAKVKDHPSGTASFSYQIEAPLKTGSHQIIAKAYLVNQPDFQSQESFPKHIEVVGFPAPTILVPQNNTSVPTAYPQITGLAFNDSLVKIFLDGQLKAEIQTKDDSSGVTAFSYKAKKPLDLGRHIVYATAADSNGRVSELSKVVVFQLNPYHAPTLFEISSSKQTIEEHPVATGVIYNDSYVEIYVNGQKDGEFRVKNHQSGTAYFAYKLKTKLETGKFYTVYSRARNLQDKPSRFSNQIILQKTLPYIPPTLLRTIGTSAYPIASGVAHNDSRVEIYVNGQKDGELQVENHSSGTAYFAYQIQKALSADSQINSIAYDKNNKPSLVSNVLTYSLPASQATAKQPQEGEPAEDIEAEASEEDKKAEETKEAGKVEADDEADDGKIIAKGEPEADEPVYEEGEVQIEETPLELEAEEEEIESELSEEYPQTRNWPMITGFLILLALILSFIIWYFAQRRETVNENIEKLFTDDEDGSTGGDDEFKPDSDSSDKSEDVGEDIGFGEPIEQEGSAVDIYDQAGPAEKQATIDDQLSEESKGASKKSKESQTPDFESSDVPPPPPPV